MPKKQNSVYTRQFGLICVASLFFSASYNMLIPELPAYLSGLGGAEYIGLIIALFTLTAGLSRPFSGKLTDTIGRKKVMLFGASVCLLCGFLYPLLATVAGFLFIRLLHGFSTGFTPTGLAAYVSDIIPQHKWGEALGLQSMFISVGLAMGPALGSFIKLYFSYKVLFLGSSAMAMTSMLLIFGLKETIPADQKTQFSLSSLKITKNDIISLEVWFPALITFLGYLSFGVILTLIPDWSDHLGIVNKGLFFVVFTISSLLSRFLAGRASDSYGRKPIVMMGFATLLISLVIIGYFETVTGLMIGAAIYGFGMGVWSPALNAWTIDLSKPKEKGKAISTMYIALELGIGLGALFSGWYYQSNIYNIPWVFIFCALMALAGILAMVLRKGRT